MSEHKQVLIEENGMRAEVDENIAPLIRELWKLHILTLMSCEDNVPEGWIWIKFNDSHGVKRFLDIIAAEYDEDSDSLYDRATRHGSYGENSWQYEILPDDKSIKLIYGTEEIFAQRIGTKTDIRLHISVRFPQSDYDEVLKKMVAHNNKFKKKLGPVTE